MKMAKSIFIIFAVLCFLVIDGPSCAQTSARQVGPSPEEAFDKPGLYTAKQLFELAKTALKEKRFDAARLFALRIFFDGVRSKSLLNLLGIVEVQAGRPLLASVWFRKSLSLGINNKLAQRYLARLPGKPRPIPVDPTRLSEHFTEITQKLPELLNNLTSDKLHFNAIMKALERGQIYMALALAEEYEKKNPGPDGASLTALCALQLGRNKDALQLVEANLQKSPYHPILLFVKAMLTDKHPGSSSPSFFRALYDLDKWAKALSLVDEYARVFPASPDAHIVETRILLDLHKTDEAAQALQQAAIKDPGNPEIDLLWVEYFLQKNEPDRASRRLSRAFRRGYNLPSVSLTAGLFAIQGGRINEVNVILNDARNSRPFTDPEAYPLYITLLLMIDNIIEARGAIDEWRERTAERSMYCYLEALYNFKIGDNRKALAWLRKGFDMNSNRLGILQFISGFPAISDDPALAAMINNRLAQAGIAGYSARPVPDTQISYEDPAAGQATSAPANTAAPTGPVKGDDMFQITLGPGIDPSARTMLASELVRMYERIASRIGTINVPIFINFVSAEGLGATIALYEPQNTGITVTSIYYDSEMIRSIILSNFDALSEQEMGPLIEELPSHTLAKELTQLIIQIIVPGAKTNPEKTAWLQTGLSEILGGSQITLRYRLLIAGKSIDAKIARLTSTNMLNSIFAEGYSSPSVLETANAQAYLMTAFLAKKSGSLEKGCRDIMALIKMISEGADFPASLKKVYKMTEADFDKGWKESAYWAIKQGAPYQW
jgi:tetratricopeptide (TPR) repeat protein